MKIMITGVGVYCIISCIDNLISRGHDVVRIDNLPTELDEEKKTATVLK
jgi:Trk K+ transport system NAD-binding subunit